MLTITVTTANTSNLSIAEISENGILLRKSLFAALGAYSYINARGHISQPNDSDEEFLRKNTELKAQIKQSQICLDLLKQATTAGPIARFTTGTIYKFVEFPPLDSSVLLHKNAQPLLLEEAEKTFRSYYLLTIREPYYGAMPKGYQLMGNNALTGIPKNPCVIEENEDIAQKNMWYQEMFNLTLSNKVAVDLQSTVLYWGKWYRLDNLGNETPVYFLEGIPENPRPLRDSPQDYKKNFLPETPGKPQNVTYQSEK